MGAEAVMMVTPRAGRSASSEPRKASPPSLPSRRSTNARSGGRPASESVAAEPRSRRRRTLLRNARKTRPPGCMMQSQARRFARGREMPLDRERGACVLGDFAMSTPAQSVPPEPEHRPRAGQRLKRFLLGGPKDLQDPHLFRHISLIAFLAWVGLGADGLSSSAYGPEEAFKNLG